MPNANTGIRLRQGDLSSRQRTCVGAAAHHGPTWRWLPSFTRMAESKHRDPRRPDDRDFHGLIDIGQKANQPLQAEPLQTTSLEIGHPRLIDSKPSSRHVLVPTPDHRKYLAKQLLFEILNWVFLLNHSERWAGARLRWIPNPYRVSISAREKMFRKRLGVDVRAAHHDADALSFQALAQWIHESSKGCGSRRLDGELS